MENTARKHASIIINGQDSAVLEDTYLLAALLTFDPTLKYCPVWDGAGKVVFEVNGRIADMMGRLYAGEEAPLTSYIRHLKALRSAIFALRSCAKRR